MAITLAQAEALTLGTHEAQRDIVQRLADGYHYDAEDIRNMLLGQRPSAALARFPLEQYQGTYTTDLFGEDATTYFDDVEQFFALQRQAVAAMAEDYAVKAEWVEVTEHYNIPRWHYRQAEDGATGGVVINLAPSGQSKCSKAWTATPSPPARPRRPPTPPSRPNLSPPIARSCAAPWRITRAWPCSTCCWPTRARPRRLLSCCCWARRITCRASAYRVTIASTPSRRRTPPVSYQGVEQEAKRLAAALGLVDDEKSVGWQRLRCSRGNATTLYEALKALSDEDLDRLHLLLTVLAFGQGDCSRLDTGDTLFNRVARDLGADMRAYWRPDTEFLTAHPHAA